MLLKRNSEKNKYNGNEIEERTSEIHIDETTGFIDKRIIRNKNSGCRCCSEPLTNDSAYRYVAENGYIKLICQKCAFALRPVIEQRNKTLLDNKTELLPEPDTYEEEDSYYD